jgi:serine/threonine protein kinase
VQIGDFGLATTDIGYDLYGDIDFSGLGGAGGGQGGIDLAAALAARAEPQPHAHSPTHRGIHLHTHTHMHTLPLPETDTQTATQPVTQTQTQTQTHTQPTDQSCLDPHTRGVGTALYRAPEQGAAAAACERSYDSKADIFSLGIILFEMCHRPFGTAMERIEKIRALREHKRLPFDFESTAPAYFRRLILWMVDADPASRPTALELRQAAPQAAEPARRPSLSPRYCPSPAPPAAPSPSPANAPAPDAADASPRCSIGIPRDGGAGTGAISGLQDVPVFFAAVPYLLLRELGSILGARCSGITPPAEKLDAFVLSSAYAVPLQGLLLELQTSLAGSGPGSDLASSATSSATSSASSSASSSTSSSTDIRTALLFSSVDNRYDLVYYSNSTFQDIS